MPRRHVVRDLSDEEFEFVIRRILDGDTDRELSAAFEAQFGKRLAKSSLARWREASGAELVDRYRLARFTAQQLVANLKEEPGADRYQILMRDIEDRLLTATREAIAQDPIKLLVIRQEEERRRLRERGLELKREQLDLEREKVRGAAVDRKKLSEEFLADLLEYIDQDAEGLRFFQKHAKNFEEFLGKKYAEA